MRKQDKKTRILSSLNNWTDRNATFYQCSSIPRQWGLHLHLELQCNSWIILPVIYSTSGISSLRAVLTGRCWLGEIPKVFIQPHQELFWWAVGQGGTSSQDARSGTHETEQSVRPASVLNFPKTLVWFHLQPLSLLITHWRGTGARGPLHLLSQCHS